MFRFLAYLSAAMLAIAPAQAAVIFSSDNGWYDKTGAHEVGNPNTVTRAADFRSFYTFDAKGADPVDQLFVTFLGGNGTYYAPSGYLYFQLYDYAGSVDALSDGTGGAAAYDDLGNGFIGSTYLFNLDTEGAMPEFTVQLYGPIVDQFNAAAKGGGKIAFGATVTNAGFAWSASDLLPAAFLTTVPAVPEPATWAMMIAGFGIMGLTMRRNKRRTPALN